MMDTLLVDPRLLPQQQEPDHHIDDLSRGEWPSHSSDTSSSAKGLVYEMSGSPSTIRVAILGGGLIGALLLRGLLRYRHIAVDIYETRPTFREEGQGIAITETAQNILHDLDPSIGHCLYKAGTVQTTATAIHVASGPAAGQKIRTKGTHIDPKKFVSRQALLDELLKGTPPRMTHVNARISHITELAGVEGLLLVFADGTQKKYDVVIGADGTHSTTRQHVLGAGDPAVKPQHTGVWALPITVPIQAARDAMGPDFLSPESPRQSAWIADGVMLQSDIINDGKDVAVCVFVRHDDTADDSSWARLFTPDEFIDIFAHIPLQPCRGIINLIQNAYTVQLTGICQMQHLPARSYVTKNVGLIGDAAHSMLVFQGSNVVIACEEALILSTLLGRASSRDYIPAALQAYDQVCRPRAEPVVRYARECGRILTGRGPGIGLNPDLIGQAIETAWAGLTRPNIEDLRTIAIDIMDGILSMDAAAWQ
ncbi:hypothetical protein F5Y15DRAFT_236433 [Xylariaceae sp. FL0016]|nr:hypothetical protein F5Y15DRAFT_236433 [Xylariaceae sp. FL0016]